MGTPRDVSFNRISCNAGLANAGSPWCKSDYAKKGTATDSRVTIVLATMGFHERESDGSPAFSPARERGRFRMRRVEAAGPHTSVWGFHEKVGRCQVRGFDEGFGEALAWLPDSIPIAAGRASFDRASIRTVGYVHSRTLCWLGSCLVGAAFSESACGRKLSPPSAARPTRAVTVTRSRLPGCCLSVAT